MSELNSVTSSSDEHHWDSMMFDPEDILRGGKNPIDDSVELDRLDDDFLMSEEKDYEVWDEGRGTSNNVMTTAVTPASHPEHHYTYEQNPHDPYSSVENSNIVEPSESQNNHTETGEEDDHFYEEEISTGPRMGCIRDEAPVVYRSEDPRAAAMREHNKRMRSAEKFHGYNYNDDHDAEEEEEEDDYFQPHDDDRSPSVPPITSISFSTSSSSSDSTGRSTAAAAAAEYDFYYGNHPHNTPQPPRRTPPRRVLPHRATSYSSSFAKRPSSFYQQRPQFSIPERSPSFQSHHSQTQAFPEHFSSSSSHQMHRYQNPDDCSEADRSYHSRASHSTHHQPEHNDYKLPDMRELEYQYQQTLKKLARSMRRSDATRMEIKRQRLAFTRGKLLPTRSFDSAMVAYTPQSITPGGRSGDSPDFFTSNRCRELEESRRKLFKMIANNHPNMNHA